MRLPWQKAPPPPPPPVLVYSVRADDPETGTTMWRHQLTKGQAAVVLARWRGRFGSSNVQRFQREA